jgi:hypothetical protein
MMPMNLIIILILLLLGEDHAADLNAAKETCSNERSNPERPMYMVSKIFGGFRKGPKFYFDRCGISLSLLPGQHAYIYLR